MDRTALSDRQRRTLVRRARGGDGRAFGRLVQDCAPTLYRVCLGATGGNEADAADAVQTALVSAWQNIGSLREPGHFKTWIIRICLNACTDLARRHRPTTPLDEHGESLADPQPRAEATLEADAGFRELIQAAGADNGIVIALYYGEGYRTGEIAELLGITSAAVRQRLSRGRRAIARALDAATPDDATPHSVTPPSNDCRGRVDDPRAPAPRPASSQPLSHPTP